MTGRAPRRGHAIEIRLNAEDPEFDFLPSPGPDRALPGAAGPGRARRHVPRERRVDPAVLRLAGREARRLGLRPARGDRARRARARETAIEGVPTTRDLALEILASEPFASGDYSTSTLEEIREVRA